MHGVAYFDFITFLASLAGLIILWAGKNKILSLGTTLVLSGLMIFTLIYGFCLAVEWSGITTSLDVLEDFIGALLPMWWAFVFYAFLQDISKQNLKQSEEKYREIFNATSESIIIHDAETGDILDVNNPMLEMYGYSHDELIDLKISDLSSDEEPYTQQEAVKYVKNAVEQGPQLFEWQAKKKNGEHFWVEVALSSTHIGGEGRVLAVARDISERKHIEEQRKEFLRQLSEKNDELESILYVSTHDLKSPLVNVAGFSSELAGYCTKLEKLIEMDSIEEEHKKSIELLINDLIPESIKFINAGTQRSKLLLDALHKVLYAGRVKTNIEILNMDRLLEQVKNPIAATIKQHNIKMTIEKLPDCLGDAELVSQVFTNLINNAMQYLLPDRKGKIHITGQTKNNMSIYCVEDSGMGIAVEHQPKIFELFHRLNPKDGIEAQGLGLTITKRMLQRQSGDIWVESKVGKGSKFYISLPAQAP